MITSNGTLSKLKCCGIIAVLTFSTSARAQQLYSDSAVAAMTEQSLCMVLPDTTQVAFDVNSLLFAPDFSIATLEVPSFLIQQCGECFSYRNNYFNFASLLVSPVWSYNSASLSCVYAYVPPAPPNAECQLGIVTATHEQGVQFAAYISDAAKLFSTLGPPLTTVENEMS
jgi:hypothetical protein